MGRKDDRIKNINKIYQTKSKNVKHAFKNVSLKFENQGLIAVIGRSGIGKSTLLNILGRLDTLDEGEIYINGISKIEWDSIRNTLIGFIFQDYYLIDSLLLERI